MSKNSNKRFAPKLNIKKGDKVFVIAGEDKNTEKGSAKEVLEVFPNKNKAIVDGVNVQVKNNKPTAQSAGSRTEKPMPVNISNLMLQDPKTGEPTRVGRKLVDGKLVRYAKKSGEIIS